MSTSTDATSTALIPEPGGSPVFVDASGRRARRIERLAAVVVLACIGYGVALLIAAATGVPIQGAIVPYPDLGASSKASEPEQVTPQPSGGIGGALIATPTTATAKPTATPTAAASARATAGAIGITSASHASSHPTARHSATATASATATSTRGKSASAPGSTHRPTTKPSVSNTHSPAVHP